ncbi:hypothetical protein ACJBLD_17265 [Acinetobacter nosocomialis]|uniref:hypothetical protein n=1 Tax=Acinetobacter nosocomialis TaxID=106654 RepID=UPI000DE77E79|nr:hypothetical protein [Acinetobacter nosocomialis]MBP1471222.1 hypothetical protein [Acinetobacter nosocomialis]MBR7692625.1 hypothetical protein [Acinetobacter nosocomialis]SSR50168.1 Uncharacterised protein [Acinetobacter nosocomialis]HCT5802098.1 hypothetical protein [Acinetobacter nosocomialis]
MRFYHQTSPENAVNVIRTKNFIGNAMKDDDGLNGYVHVSQLIKTRLEGVGSELVLQWLGPVHVVNTDELPVYKMKKNVLYSQYEQTEEYEQPRRWREFIPSPMHENLLKVVNIKFLRGNKIDDLIIYPDWYRFIPFKKIKTKFERGFKLRFIKELRDEYINRELFLKIN